MDPQVPTPDAKTQARRRLIRGSFSVPAVLAVHNGSALAASSNKFRCAINATTGASNPAPAPGPADNWTRVPVYQWDKDANTTKYYVKSADLIAVASSRGLGYVPPSGTDTGWIAFKSGAGYAFVKAPGGTVTVSSANAAVLFDTVGTAPSQTVRVVGFVQPGSATTVSGMGAISASCWTSIQP